MAANKPVTIGVPLGEGVAATGITFVAAKSDGTLIPSQWNELATWRTDGSILHGVLTFLTPDVGDNSGSYKIVAGSPVSGTDVSQANVLSSGLTAVISATIGGTVYSLSLVDLLDGTVTPELNYTHITGPIMSEWRIGGALRINGTGAVHSSLQGYFNVRAYKISDSVSSAQVIFDLDNNTAFTTSATGIIADVALILNGLTVYSRTAEPIYQQATYTHRAWWSAPNIYTAIPGSYLMETRLIPNYRSVTVQESTLAALRTTADWNALPQSGNPAMTSTGNSPHLGFFDKATSLWILSGDQRAYNAMLVEADVYKTMRHNDGNAFHARDENTRHPLDLATYPTDLWQEILDPGDNIIRNDWAHGPSCSYIPYLTSGSVSDLDAMALKSVGALAHRVVDDWTIAFERILQTRANGWALRQIVHGAAIAPDAYPLKSSMKLAVEHSLQVMKTRPMRTNDIGPLGMAARGPGGAYDIILGDKTLFYMQDYLTYGVYAASVLGWGSEAADVVSWRAIGCLARAGFVQTGSWDPHVAGAYQQIIYDTVAEQVYQTWAEVAAANGVSYVPWSDGDTISGGESNPADYTNYFHIALHLLSELGVPNAQEAYDQYEGRSKPWDNSDFERYANWAIGQ
jgi:hypothetical protein